MLHVELDKAQSLFKVPGKMKMVQRQIIRGAEQIQGDEAQSLL